MHVAFCIYDGMTVLDFVGAYDPITRLDRMEFQPITWDVCGLTKSIRANELHIGVDRVRPSLDQYDLVFVPGGYEVRERLTGTGFIEWLRSATTCEYIVSVCTGTLLLAAAGLLDGKRATTHPTGMEALAEYEGVEVVTDRIVHDEGVITGRGVTSSIDLGLYVVEELTDRETREAIATQMDYPYGPLGSDRDIEE